MHDRPRWLKYIGLAAAASTLIAACSAPMPASSATPALVDRTVGPWQFREAPNQVSVAPAMPVEDAEQAALAHLANQYGASVEELVVSDALYRRDLVSIDAFGGGAHGMPREDAWVLRFSPSTTPETTAGWVVVGPQGQINASWFGY